MLKEIVSIFLKHKVEVREGTLFVYDITITGEIEKIIHFLESINAIENSSHETAIGKVVTLELTPVRLNSIGYYEDIDALIRRHKYEYPADEFYIQELNQFSDQADTGFLLQYKKVIEFIDAIKQVAKHTFQDTDTDIAVIFRDDKSLILPFYYSSNDILGLSEVKSIEYVSSTLKEATSEKKLLFINELIETLLPISEEVKFSTLLNSIGAFEEKCNNAYQYYLRDFSYNKLKIELDSKALDFTQKIQSVINDSQSKLIAIPTAFVLVFAAFDFADLFSVKNIASIISLFIFAVIIQIFLNNQYSVLRFTKVNIEAYKGTFKQNNVAEFLKKFAVVDTELKKQQTRLYIVTAILWLIPIGLLVMWLSMVVLQHVFSIKKVSCLILILMVFFCRG